MKKITMISVTILSLSALTAQAAIPGAYVGAGLGLSRQDTPKEFLFDAHQTPGGKDSRKLGGVGGRAFTGYNFNKFFGIEAGLAHYANSDYKSSLSGNGLIDAKGTLTYKMNALDLVAKGYLPLGESGFNLYGLAGIARVSSEKNSKVGISIPPLVDVVEKESSTAHKIRPVYGVGASYDIPQSNFTTNLEFSRVQGSGNVKKSISAIPSANLATLNLSYNFGQ